MMLINKTLKNLVSTVGMNSPRFPHYFTFRFKEMILEASPVDRL